MQYDCFVFDAFLIRFHFKIVERKSTAQLICKQNTNKRYVCHTCNLCELIQSEAFSSERENDQQKWIYCQNSNQCKWHMKQIKACQENWVTQIADERNRGTVPTMFQVNNIMQEHSKTIQQWRNSEERKMHFLLDRLNRQKVNNYCQTQECSNHR